MNPYKLNTFVKSIAWQKIVGFGLVFALFVFICGACENDIREVEALNPQNFINKEVTSDVELIYSDSAIVRTIIKADTMIYYADSKEPWQEFPAGIKVEFFDDYQRINSTLTANYAIRYDKKREIVVQDNVIWKSGKPEILETEELIWNEQDAKVTSQRYVKITTPEDEFYGYGLEADEDFSKWKINIPEGKMGAENMNQ